MKLITLSSNEYNCIKNHTKFNNSYKSNNLLYLEFFWVGSLRRAQPCNSCLWSHGFADGWQWNHSHLKAQTETGGFTHIAGKLVVSVPLYLYLSEYFVVVVVSFN